MSDIPDKELLRVDEVAEHLRVSASTIYLWIEHGHLKAVKIVGVVRIERESVLKLKMRPES